MLYPGDHFDPNSEAAAVPQHAREIVQKPKVCLEMLKKVIPPEHWPKHIYTKLICSLPEKAYISLQPYDIFSIPLFRGILGRRHSVTEITFFV